MAVPKHVESRSVAASPRWREAVWEPDLADLLGDPIAHLLRRRDGLTRADVERAVGLARQRVMRADTTQQRSSSGNHNTRYHEPEGS